MKNLGQMLKQAQEMQAKMQEMQDMLANIEVIGSAGGGMCEVTMSGKGEARKVAIDRTLLAPDEVEVLEDLILTAINDAKSKAEEKSRSEMQKLTGGLELPPGFHERIDFRGGADEHGPYMWVTTPLALVAGEPISDLQRASALTEDMVGGASTVGITAGASAPEVLVQEVIEALSAHRDVEVSSLTTAEENVTFKLPRALAG